MQQEEAAAAAAASSSLQNNNNNNNALLSRTADYDDNNNNIIVDSSSNNNNDDNNDNNYNALLKEQKEQFVTGHSGTSPFEILLVSSAAPIGILLFRSLRALEAFVVIHDGIAGDGGGDDDDDDDDGDDNVQVEGSRSSRSKSSSSIVVEAIVLWFPLLICQTEYLYPWGIILLCIQLQMSAWIAIYIWSTRRWMKLRKMDPNDRDNDDDAAAAAAAASANTSTGKNRKKKKKNSTSTTMARLESVQEEDVVKVKDKHELNFTTSTVQQQQEQQHLQSEQRIMKDVMTIYRSSMLYMTFVAILAVDFHVFPRRFAKTEVTGYGLMDLGAGSFVVAAGLVSPRARRRRQQQQQQQQHEKFGKRDVVRILPLLIIGFVRLATNKGLEYQEHVSEYGVHWNFFFTLAFVTPVGALLDGTPHWTVPTLLLSLYQYMLTQLGGQEFIETAPRTHCSSCISSSSLWWLSYILPVTGNDNMDRSSTVWHQLCTLFCANREGVLGCIGYLFLYLFAEYLAYAFVWIPSPSTTIATTRTNAADTTKTLSLWMLTGGLWLCLCILVEGLEIPVSRRSTNASFCVWTLAHNMTLLAAIHTCYCLHNDEEADQDGQSSGATLPQQSTTPTRPRVPIVFQAVNRHGLLAFLVANLLTGITNISINTLEVSDPVALLVLFVYLCAVGGFALVLHHFMTRTASSTATKEEEHDDRGKTKTE